MLEESKGQANDEEHHCGGSDSEEELDMTYPDECKVLDIMRDKYYDAV